MKAIILMICIISNVDTSAQTAKATPFYIDLARSEKTTTHIVNNDILSFKYDDKQGKSEILPLKIYDWKRNQILTLALNKQFGLNYFDLNLKDLYGSWESERVYQAVVIDEANQKSEILFKLSAPPDKTGPEVEIIVNPIALSCEDVTGNMVQFYGKVSGGKAPYELNWYVLNEAQSEFLYQPRTMAMPKPGRTAMIEVNRSPVYNVLLEVKDACGNIERQQVQLVCEDGEKKVNTIFFQKTQLPKWEPTVPGPVTKPRGN